MRRTQVWALVCGGAAAVVFLVACSSTLDGTADGAAGVEEAQSAPTRDAERADTAASAEASAGAAGGDEAEAEAPAEGDEEALDVDGEEAASEGEEADEDVEVAPVRLVGDPFVGACWALPEGEFSFAVAPLLSCEGPHQSEVFWLGLPPLALLQAGYSESDLFDAVGPICNAALFGYQGGTSSESLQIFVQLPTEEEWAAGRFVYSCSAFDGGGQLLVGSLRVEAAGFPSGVVFAAREREAYTGLRFVRQDGLAIPVDVASPNGVVRDVAWFPDGQRVVFAARGDNSQAFNLFTLDGLQRPLVQLTDTFADNVSPAVSPDGTRIVFASARDGNLELYVMDADGRNVRRLTETPDLAENSPSWSPDGSRIVFHGAEGVSDILGGDVYVMVADGSDQRLLARDAEGRQLRGPRWSPDGSRIVAERTVGRDFGELVLIDAETGGLTSLRVCRCEGPDWSPDGASIAYYAPPESSREAEGIWVVSVEGGEAVQVSMGARLGPVWRPVR